MKAVIVEIQGKYAIALDKKGSFIKVKNTGNMEVGYEIDIPASPVVNMNKFRKIASLAASFLFVASLGIGTYAYTAPYSYINIDINPSVELTSNVFDRIIKAEALNDDGKKILEKAGYKNKTIREGIDGIFENAVKEGYIQENAQNAVMITVSGKNENRTKEIRKGIEEETKTQLVPEKIKVDVVVENVNIQRHEEARKAGVSPGKMLLIDRLKEADPQAKTEDYKNLPVREIMKTIIEKKKEDKKEQKEKSEEKKPSLEDVKNKIKEGIGKKDIEDKKDIKDIKDIKDQLEKSIKKQQENKDKNDKKIGDIPADTRQKIEEIKDKLEEPIKQKIEEKKERIENIKEEIKKKTDIENRYDKESGEGTSIKDRLKEKQKNNKDRIEEFIKKFE